MDTKALIQSQYDATLDMLDEAIQACPEDLWADTSFKNAFWHVAYHALFYTHLYLGQRLENFVPWSKGRPEYELLGDTLPWDPQRKPKIGEPYTKGEVLEYLAFCRQVIENQVPALDLEAASGFDWLPFDKLELQFYNIRHAQHHTGQLTERLRSSTGTGIRWVGHHPQASGGSA
jgi:hypothetical protein